VAEGDRDFWLLKPATYMNESGRSVAAFLRFHKMDPAEMLVVHDELDLPPGTVRLKKGGYDGCDIPFYGGHLIENFLSPLSNRRTDEYGGSLDNRLRLATEVVRAVREAVGRDARACSRNGAPPLWTISPRHSVQTPLRCPCWWSAAGNLRPSETQEHAS